MRQARGTLGHQSGTFVPNLGHTSDYTGHKVVRQGGPPTPPRELDGAESRGCAPTVFPQSAQEYRQRSLLEKELLFFAYDVFGIPFVDPVSLRAGAGSRRGQRTGVGCTRRDSREKAVRR